MAKLIEKTVVINSVNSDNAEHHIHCSDNLHFAVKIDLAKETIKTGQAYVVEFLNSQAAELLSGKEVPAKSFKGPLKLDSGNVATTEGK
jgi:hypothetical protein